MKANYAIIQPWVLAYEGGYVNHPKDPGGATMQGVTQRTYDAFRRRVGRIPRPVRQLEAVERDTIYREQYWDVVRGDDLPSGVDAAVYDFAVNSGPARAARYLQRIAGVTQDGVIGLQTLDAVARLDPVVVVERLCDDRMAFLRGLRTWSTFGKGWSRRVVGDRPGVQDGDIGILDRATMLARGQRTIPKPKVTADGAGKRVNDPARQGFWAAIFSAIAAMFKRGR